MEVIKRNKSSKQNEVEKKLNEEIPYDQIND